MKTERLYAITLHLLNHGRTPAAELARRFEVSVRTIQRDIDALCRAGIPVAAETGMRGGYRLADGFRMDAHTASPEEYSRMFAALRGYASATGEREAQTTAEKLRALAGSAGGDVMLELSSLRERDGELIALLRGAISAKKAVRFGYTNAGNEHRQHTVEPVAVIYRWYAWYLLAYSREKDDYRTYKLARMDAAAVTCEDFIRAHDSPERILERCGTQPEATEISVRCSSGARARAKEYLNGVITAEDPDGSCTMTLKVIESEQFWFGMLMSLGGGIEVLAPERIRRRVTEAAQGILRIYGEKQA